VAEAADESEIQALLEALDGTSVEVADRAMVRLREVLGEDLPRRLLEVYRSSTRWKMRLTCVFLSIRYARRSSAAVTMAREALFDRSKKVRYRACMLLACSLDEESIPVLERALEGTEGQDREDVLAALDAIRSRNHNYFLDRDHSGRVTLNFEGRTDIYGGTFTP
jgi:hypothetical protein